MMLRYVSAYPLGVSDFQQSPNESTHPGRDGEPIAIADEVMFLELAKFDRDFTLSKEPSSNAVLIHSGLRHGMGPMGQVAQ